MVRLFSLLLPLWWLLLLVVLPSSIADLQATSGGVETTCTKDRDCDGELTCKLGYCVAEKCITRELKAAGARFDPLEYKQMIFEEAKVKEIDLFKARVENPNNVDFVRAAPVVAIKKTLQAHSNELLGLAAIMRYCSSSDGSETTLSQEEDNVGGGHRQRRRTKERDLREDSASSEELEVASSSSDEESLFSRSVEVGGGIGAWVGNLFAAVTSLFTGRDQVESNTKEKIPVSYAAEKISVEKIPVEDSDDTDEPTPTPSATPSAAPSISMAPSVSSAPSFQPSVSLQPSATPSAEPSAQPSVSVQPSSTPSVSPSSQPSESPTYSVSQKIYIGFHLEGGLLMDYSCSYLFPTEDTTNDNDLSDEYTRACFGAEFGVGAEVAFVAVFANVRENADIVGVNLMAEFADFGLGVHFGAGVGVFTEGGGTQNGNDLLLYEATIGAGLGFSIFGTAVCRINELVDGI